MEKEKLLAWLLEEENPSVRAFTLQNILDVAEDDARLEEARSRIMAQEPVTAILGLQTPQGWWGNGDSMIMPMYTSTAWQIMLLAELGARLNERIKQAVDLVFAQVQAQDGSFPRLEGRFVKRKPMDLFCNDVLIAFGLLGVGMNPSDERMRRTLDFIARTLLSGEYGCRFNDGGAPCAWGVVKGLRVLALVKEEDRSELMNKAIKAGAEYLLEHDLKEMDFSSVDEQRFSDHWFRLGFPRSYQADVLQAAFVLTKLGYAQDRRLEKLVDFLARKELPAGGWALDESWNRLTVSFTKPSKRKANKWITWQVYTVLTRSGRI